MVEVSIIMVGGNTLIILNTISIIIVVVGILVEATTAEEGTMVGTSRGIMSLHLSL